MTGKRHFARFRNYQDPCGFRNVGVAWEILHSDNRSVDNLSVDNQGSDNRRCNVHPSMVDWRRSGLVYAIVNTTPI